MAYGITCTHCGANYSLNMPLRCGLKICCAECRKSFTIGRQGVAADPGPGAPHSPSQSGSTHNPVSKVAGERFSRRQRKAVLGLATTFMVGLVGMAAFAFQNSDVPVKQWNVEANSGGGGTLFALYGRSPRSIEKVIASFREGPRAADPRWVSRSVGAVTLGRGEPGRPEVLRVRFTCDKSEWDLSIGNNGCAVALESFQTSLGARVTRTHKAVAHPSP